MQVVKQIADLRAALEPARREGRSIGLVPTMGAFHEGHLSLMRRARADCDLVVVSLFVNPTQFGAGEDLESYPRDLDRDRELAGQNGVDLLFTPAFDELYPAGHVTWVEVGGITERLCGAPGRRGPEHFRGVATVVVKLLNICRPDVAYFGAKDFQQARVIERVVLDLDLPVRIEVCPTVRDQDGLALSSRNAYLSPAQRRDALAFKRALDAAERAIEAGASSATTVRAAALEVLCAGGVEPEYVEVVDARDLSPLDRLDAEQEVLIAVAARVGGTRLIDNTVSRLPARGAGEQESMVITSAAASTAASTAARAASTAATG